MIVCNIIKGILWCVVESDVGTCVLFFFSLLKKPLCSVHYKPVNKPSNEHQRTKLMGQIDLKVGAQTQDVPDI